jgi:hypothetical protein
MAPVGNTRPDENSILDGLIRDEQSPRKGRRRKGNGPVTVTRPFDKLDPAIRAAIEAECDQRGVAYSDVQVVSPNEVIFPN